MMTKTEFLKWANGRAIDTDGVPSQKYQCVDEVKSYMLKCYNISITFSSPSNPHGYAKGLWYYFNEHPELKGKFIRIKNTPDFVPQKGDIVEWDTYQGVTGTAGHTAIALGKNNGTSTFWSMDQNWGGKYYCTEVKHNYKGVLGVIRPLYKCTTANLNVRSGPGTDNPVVDEIPKGTLVKPVEYSGSWARIGENKWVSAKYLD